MTSRVISLNMKKFKYKMEFYLNYRQSLRNKSIKDFKEAEVYKNFLLEKQGKIKKQIKNSQKMNAQLGKKSLIPEHIQANNKFIEKLKKEEIKIIKEIEVAEERIKEKKIDFLKNHKKFKIIEIHKNQELLNYRKKMKKNNQKQTDEMNLIKPIRS